MDITSSIFGLTKNNNGYFKSEKQASYLISKIDSNSGLIGHSSNGNPYFAEYDKDGITRIVKWVKNNQVVMFERAIKGQLNSLQQKEFKSIERRIKKLKREWKNKEESFESGNYNGTGDKSTYTEFSVKLYHKHKNAAEDLIRRLEERKNNLINQG